MIAIPVQNRDTGQVAMATPRFDKFARRTVIEVFEELPLFGESSRAIIASYRSRNALWRKWERIGATKTKLADKLTVESSALFGHRADDLAVKKQ